MESTQSSFQDLDQAKLAAKMALAHKGLDIEVLKKRQARYLEMSKKNFFLTRTFKISALITKPPRGKRNMQRRKLTFRHMSRRKMAIKKKML